MTRTAMDIAREYADKPFHGYAKALPSRVTLATGETPDEFLARVHGGFVTALGQGEEVGDVISPLRNNDPEEHAELLRRTEERRVERDRQREHAESIKLGDYVAHRGRGGIRGKVLSKSIMLAVVEIAPGEIGYASLCDLMLLNPQGTMARCNPGDVIEHMPSGRRGAFVRRTEKLAVVEIPGGHSIWNLSHCIRLWDAHA